MIKNAKVFFTFILGMCAVIFCVCFVTTIIWWLVAGTVASHLLWADFASFTVAILCLPCITLSEAKRTKDSNKRWVKENGAWKNDKEKQGL